VVIQKQCKYCPSFNKTALLKKMLRNQEQACLHHVSTKAELMLKPWFFANYQLKLNQIVEC